MNETEGRAARRWRSAGQILPLFAGAIILLVGMLALVSDLASYWAASLRVQRAADSAALAGAVYLPGNVSRALSAARAEATKNGFTGGATMAGGTVAVTPVQDASNPRTLKVTVAAPVQMYFIRIFGIDSIRATRDARAEFTLPVPMGSPEDYYGIDRMRSELDPTGTIVNRASSGTPISPRGFWGALLTKGSNRTSGDAFSPAYNPRSTANVDFRAGGYDYTVEFTGSNGRVWIFDPVFCAVGKGTTGAVSGQYLGTGDHWLDKPSGTYDSVTTVYRMYDTNDTPYDKTDDTLVADSGTAFANQRAIDRSRDYGGNGQYSDQTGSGPVYTIPVGNRPNAGANSNTTLNGAASAGATAISVSSASNISLGDILMVEGYTGTYAVAKREFVRVRLAPSGSSVPVAGLGTASGTLFAHSSGVSVQEIDAAALSTAAAVGNNSVAVSGSGYTTAKISANDYVVIDPMSLNAEARRVTGVTATSITLDAPLAFAHPVNTVVARDTTNTAGWSGCGQYRGGWYQLVSGLAAGRYRVQASTNDDANLNTNAENMWGFQVADSSGTPQVYGSGAMGAYTNLPNGTQAFYLAKIGAEHAGKTVQIDLFDPGDVGGNATLKILTPNGNAYNYATFSYTADNGRSGTNVTSIAVASGGTSYYNNSWIRVLIPLPATYGCSPLSPCLRPAGEAEQGWWKIEYTVGGGNDTTTWMVNIRGNPVHLILP
jgi:hypothetical protein